MKLRSAAVLWICAGVTGNGIAWPQTPPVIKSETKLVVVDVVATDKKGAYIRDLTPKDFRLWDDNKEQTIQSFALESAGGANPAAARTDYVVLAFDYAGMDAGDQIRARQAAARFIDAMEEPNRRMAVANIDAGLRIAQAFTDNAGRLKDAVTGAKSSVMTVNNTKAGASASADLGSRDRFLALTSLASDLNAAPGRKTIVLFTGSLTAASDQKGALSEVMEACNRANVTVYPVDVRDVSLPSNFDASNGATGRGGRGGGGGAGMAGGRGGRGGASTGGGTDPDVAADPTGASQQVLFTLATGTGGFVIRNASELPAGLAKIGQEQEQHYVLGFTPTESKEGSCHALKVKVERSGVTLRARSGYCTGKQEELAAANPAENDLAKRAAAAQAGNIAASMRLPFFYAGAGVARVDATLEIQPEAIKFEKKKDSLHADINVLGIAATAGGDVGARFSDTLTLDFDAADEKWKEKPLHYEKEFKIAPGQYTLTVVFSAGGENFGKVTQPLSIEPYQPGQFALSGLALGKEIRRPVVGESVSTASLFDDRTPLMISGVELIPTGAVGFTKPESAFCYFEIYPSTGANGEGGSPTLRVRILNAKTGGPAWDGGIAKADFPAGKSTVPFGLSLPIAMLAPGAYQVEATVTDGAGKTAQRTASFEIK